MKIIIRGTGCISPQKTFSKEFLEEINSFTGEHFTCIEPDYKEIINPALLRRMSRIIKMGVASAKMCLADAAIEMPGAIITGTGLGCLQDTIKFMDDLVENGEKMLNPAPFIQSTHNTVSAQIALLLKCRNYNITYAHRGNSFESALLDGIMHLNDKTAENILVGGIDEITPVSFDILKRLGCLKSKTQTPSLKNQEPKTQNKSLGLDSLNGSTRLTTGLGLGTSYNEPCASNELLSSGTPGSLAGEGSAYFLLSSQPHEKNYAIIRDIDCRYKPGASEDISKVIINFLKKNQLDIKKVMLVIFGLNGDNRYDFVYRHLQNEIFSNTCQAAYKHLCGEYHTAVAFALWLAANILKKQHIPHSTILYGGPLKNGYLDTIAAQSLDNRGKRLLCNHSIIGNQWLPSVCEADVSRQPPSPIIENVLIYNHYKNTNHSLILLSKC
ncbi:MAG: beta-ketoacyl synthase chain length factor [Bacteroidia bacterium]|nr:beta-ketoacyl synthase chain length factor [Bacteroidia bacterium]